MSDQLLLCRMPPADTVGLLPVINNLNLMIMKTLRCRDAGFDCDKEIHASSDDAVMSQAAEHALKAHNVQVTPELASQIKKLIREEHSHHNAS